WTSAKSCAALRHDPKCKDYNQHFRQLLHVGFKIAAKKGDRYLKMLEANEAIVGRNGTMNLYERHLRPLVVWRRRCAQINSSHRLDATTWTAATCRRFESADM